MTGCCDSKSDRPQAGARTARCPGCGRDAKAVARLTLLHQLKAPLNQQLAEGDYFFCATPGCERVYFSAAGVVIGQAQLRLPVGQKSADPARTLCYCFDVTYARVVEELAQTGASASQAFVTEQTRLQNCACDSRNPSGRCCLKDFPRPAPV